MLSAALILAVMVMPFTSSVAREVLKAVPRAQREGAYALGATRFEAIRAALFYARTGIVGAVMLGFGRALGETMAVTMVIGNNPQVSRRCSRRSTRWPRSSPTSSPRRPTTCYLHALIEIGLVLFIITLDRQRAVAAADLEHGAAARSRAARRGAAAVGGGRMTPHVAPQAAVVTVFVGFCAAVGAARARAAGVRPVLRRQPGRAGAEPAISSRSMPKPVGEAGGGMANAIVGTLILTGLGVAVRDPDRHPERRLHVGVRRHALRVGSCGSRPTR